MSSSKSERRKRILADVYYEEGYSSNSDNEMSQFDMLKEEVRIANGNKWHHYRKWRKFENLHIQLQRDLEKECPKHHWVIDHNRDYCHTHYLCSICKACR